MGFWPYVGLTAAFCAVTVLGEGLGRRGLVWLGKPLASTSFVALALVAGALESLQGQVLLAALALCWAGDLFLIPRGKKAFVLGLGSFLLGHIGFSAAFALRQPDLAWGGGAAALMLGVGWAVLRWLGPHLPAAMRWPVRAYVVSIGAMVALASGAAGGGAPWWLAVGAWLFCLSDMAVARDRFVARGFANQAVVLPTYYAAQLIFALSASVSSLP